MSKIHRDKIIDLMKKHNVKYQHDVHEAVRTSEEASTLRGLPMSSGAKAIILRGKKTKQSVLTVIPADRKINISEIEKILEEKVSFHPNVEEAFDCEPGSVSPFGSVLGLTTYADTDLEDTLNFNIGLRTESLQIPKEDYLKIEQPIVGNFSISYE